MGRRQERGLIILRSSGDLEYVGFRGALGVTWDTLHSSSFVGRKV